MLDNRLVKCNKYRHVIENDLWFDHLEIVISPSRACVNIGQANMTNGGKVETTAKLESLKSR